MSSGNLVLVARGIVFDIGCSVKGANSREKNTEAGNVPVRASDRAVRDAALVFLNDTSADPEAEPRALGGFGAKEGLEELARIVRMNSHTGIDDRDHGAAQVLCPVGGFAYEDAEDAAVRHGLNCIAH